MCIYELATGGNYDALERVLRAVNDCPTELCELLAVAPTDECDAIPAIKKVRDDARLRAFNKFVAAVDRELGL